MTGTGGAYGLRITGLADDRMLVPLPATLQWPTVAISIRRAANASAESRIGADEAEIGLLDGERAVLDRVRGAATFRVRRQPDDGRILHPFLTVVATVFAWWEGHSVLHGGAFLTQSGAWGLIGEQQGGKSSTLAALELAGCPVVTDDLIVVSDQIAFAGPRCIDLRPGVSEALGVTARVEPVRGGERFRLPHRHVQPESGLCGWIDLRWSDRVALRPLTPGERLERLIASSSVPPVEPSRLMDLARLPAWELSRPATLRSLEAAVDRVLSLTAA